MNLEAAERYWNEKGKRELAGGQSGAQVYDVEGEYVLKRARRAELGDDGLYQTYRREAWWYAQGGAGLGCLPEVLDLRSTEEETAILMRRYRKMERGELDGALLENILGSLALVHRAEIPAELREKRPEARPLSPDEIGAAMEGWRQVLGEHRGAFDAAPLDKIAGDINRILAWNAAEEAVLIHGDFHWDNLLMGEKGRVLLCDWQSVGMGAASGELSFFLGRLRGDGIRLEEREVVKAYGRARERLGGRGIAWEEIEGHIRAANVITSFTCWHEYLHGSSEERVGEIYRKMAADSVGIG